MRMIFGFVLIVGIALAGGAVYLAKDRITEYQQANARAQAALAKVVPTRSVYVATETLQYGQKLAPELVRRVDWPENAIPEGAFLEETALFPENTDELRVVLRAMEKDEAILAVKITKPGEDTGLTSRLSKGMRAVTLNVNASSGVSGFLRPGDRVDVYWTGNPRVGGGTRNGEVTKLIEAGIRIIAIDQTANGSLEETMLANTVTVEVNTQQGLRLTQAQGTGNLTLSLVGAEDETVASATEVDQRSLLGIEREEAKAEVVAEKVCTIRNNRGGEVVERVIPCATN